MASITFPRQVRIVDFDALSPLEQRKYLFELEEIAGSKFSRSVFSPLTHLFKKTALNTAACREAFAAYIDVKQVLKRRYERIQDRQVDLPIIEGHGCLISLKEALHFRDHIWEEKFSGPEQIKFLENMSNHIDVFSVPIFDIALDILKKDIEWSGPDGIFATIFIINEVIAKYRLPEDMEKKVREFLEYIIEDYKKYHKPVILAKEGLELLTYNHKTDPIEESYIATAKKCTVVAKEKITKAFVANVAILIMICFIIFWLS